MRNVARIKLGYYPLPSDALASDSFSTSLRIRRRYWTLAPEPELLSSNSPRIPTLAATRWNSMPGGRA